MKWELDHPAQGHLLERKWARKLRSDLRAEVSSRRAFEKAVNQLVRFVKTFANVEGRKSRKNKSLNSTGEEAKQHHRKGNNQGH